jgi:hypothetical protein
MRRTPNLRISQWFRELQQRPWIVDAECGSRQDLPWIADQRPNHADYAAMYDVCNQCPVVRECARYALETHIGGGFYAGVWLPWASPNESRETKTLRQYAREALRATLRNIDAVVGNR